MPFNLFHREKPQEEQPALSTQENPTQPVQEAPPEVTVPVEEPVPEPVPAPEAPATVTPAEPEPSDQVTQAPQEPSEPAQEVPQPEQPKEQPPVQVEPQETPAVVVPAEPANKTYLKAMPLKDLADVEKVKEEVSNGNIIILRITPLAGKSIEDVKKAVNDLFEFAESTKGDIARLGEERVVICPKTIRIWREKSPAPVKNGETLPPTAA